MIGIVYEKDCMPHHRPGPPPEGDSFPVYPASHFIYARKTYLNLKKYLRIHHLPGVKLLRDWLQKNKILVGNKCDMTDEKVVSTEEGEKLAAEFGIQFWECSAKNDINVDDAFIGIGRAVKDRLVADGLGGPAPGKGLNLKAGQATPQQKKCC